ncbi:HP1 family phage holin [Pantoea stewartii]|uniref:HP1 family phage holin n=1 Tax=Pantoea stewartii TaxID=66269 RepID=UPI003368351D
MWERISTFMTWSIAVFMAWLGDLSVKDVSTWAGLIIGIGMALISWYYKHKTYHLLASGRITREEYESANR